MTAIDDVDVSSIALRMKPGESTREFAARVAAAHGPLTESEVAKLRKIFGPGSRETRTAPVGTGAAA